MSVNKSGCLFEEKNKKAKERIKNLRNFCIINLLNSKNSRVLKSLKLESSWQSKTVRDPKKQKRKVGNRYKEIKREREVESDYLRQYVNAVKLGNEIKTFYDVSFFSFKIRA